MPVEGSPSSMSNAIFCFDQALSISFHFFQNILQYQVLMTNMPWDLLFQNMESLRDQYENLIEDYSVNETTLEEVFLSFARQQYLERQANVSCLKKLVTCHCCS
jgi:hypothetical protein